MVDIGIFHKKINTGKNPALTTVKVVEKYETQKNLLQGNMFMLAIWLECEKMKKYGSLSSPYNIHTSSSAFFCRQVSRQYWQLSNFILGVRRPELLHLPSSVYGILKRVPTEQPCWIQRQASAPLHKCPEFWLITWTSHVKS